MNFFCGFYVLRTSFTLLYQHIWQPTIMEEKVRGAPLVKTPILKTKLRLEKIFSKYTKKSEKSVGRILLDSSVRSHFLLHLHSLLPI